jgi:hypothetical protein
MEIEIENTKEDYTEFYKYFYFKRAIVIRIVFAIVLGNIFFGGHRTENKVDYGQIENIPKVLLAATIAFIIIALIPYFISIRKLAGAIGTNKSPEGRKKFILLDRGIQIDTPNANTFWNWESIRSADVRKNFIYIILYKYRAYIVPAKYFSSDKEMNSFVGMIQNRSFRVRNVSTERDASRLQWLGLLGIIPFIGAIAGVVLLLAGIFKFKDKYLILIGSACILFTICYYKIAFPDMPKTTNMDSYFVGTSQTRLDNLMKDVEFYKLQIGIYPGSLEEAKKNSDAVWLTDPIQNNLGRKSNKYYYKKVGDKYYLFSTGKDGIAFTDDDIYPTITSSDCSKFGLIKDNR